ncbi:MAG: GNAT family N-acetyltransferase [Anaerolineaceae bacterium]|nr:GNAT family N-acetyltransferase [Anaerolineaceae bacterium]
MIEIMAAQSGETLEALITLAQEYVDWMVGEFRARYAEFKLDEMTSKHEYDDVRKKFPGEHVPPDGCLLIAKSGEAICGCIALGRLNDDICEVRTLFVRPSCRGEGIGKVLVDAVLDQAREFGYSYARLDTLQFMDSAQRLYKAFGFYDIEPYLDFSESLKSYIRFFEMKL